MIAHIFTATIPGAPKGQPRPRAFARKMGNGKYAARVYDAGTAEGWKSCVAVACKELADRKLQDALTVKIVFFMPRPKSHFRKSGELTASAPRLFTQKPDADNLGKAVLDALTQIGAWEDDSQVCDLIIQKRWEKPGTPPGAQIDIYLPRENDQ